MNKRDFIASAGALAAACAPALAGATQRQDGTATPTAPSARGRRPVPLEGEQSRATWQQYVGHRFAVPGGTLSLASVVDAPLASAGLEQFCLVFEAPVTLQLPADTLLTVQHATGQRLPLRLQAAGSGRWHAHFSLLA